MTPDTYHHGDLPTALRAAAADVLAERGTAGFSLREVARRAGVSHAAPAHHFGDTAGLLTEVAKDGFRHLTAETQAAVEGVSEPIERLRRVGRAYVELAVRHPGHCAVMFRGDLTTPGDRELEQISMESFGVLEEAVGAVIAAAGSDLDVTLASRTCWATMQGLVSLYPAFSRIDDDSGAVVTPIGDLAEQFAEVVFVGLTGRGSGANGS